MGILAKRIVLHADNPLFREVHPVVLDIFCHGIRAANPSKLMVGALVSIVLAPFGWIMAVLGRAVHVVIFLAVWWFLRDSINAFGSLDRIVLTVGLVAIFYRQIHDELLGNFLVLVTAGGFLRWICNGYLTGGAFRQKILTTEPMQAFAGPFVAAIPDQHRTRYDKVMDLYLNSNRPDKEEKLRSMLREYISGSRP